MPADRDTGVVFPDGPDGSRSTSRLAREVLTDALRTVDPAGASAAERETAWRSGYVGHFRQLTLAGLGDRTAATRIARDGLASLHRRMRVVDAAGDEHGVEHLLTATPDAVPDTRSVRGSAEPEAELTVPYRGTRLQGGELGRQLDDWVDRGIVEPSFAAAIRTVQDNPSWLRLDDHIAVVLGAGAEMGPLPALLRWGATVAAIDLRSPELWRRIIGTATTAAGTLLVPVPTGAGQDSGGTEGIAAVAGLDLLTEVPEAAAWIDGLPGRPVLGNYVYADGAAHVRVAVAVDVLTRRLQDAHDDLALAFLATPTDVFAVPAADVARATQAYADRGRAGKLLARPLRTLSGGRLLKRAYASDVDPGICDSLVPQQGPNYALAKRVHRWRATVARDEGRPVSLHVAPATRTRSVMKNRALAAAYAGAHRFGVEIFDPGTTNTLMAALLVHDLHTGGGEAHDQVWQDEAHAAAHGGLWTCAYAPRSALGLAAVLGLGART